jgi:hypothetical protein
MLFGAAVGLIGAALGVHASISIGVICALVGLVLLLWPQHKSLKDATTLKARVIALRDDLQSFLNEMGDGPKVERESGMSESEYATARINDGLIWNDKFSHGFALRFRERAKRIFHECGEAGTTHTMFGLRIAKEYVEKSDILDMIGDLTWLAKNVD